VTAAPRLAVAAALGLLIIAPAAQLLLAAAPTSLTVPATAPGARAAASPPPNLLLVTIDTLRPDALGWVAGRNTTPTLDRLAAEGSRFRAAVSPVPLTLPAHASILTGLLPRRHGVRDNGQVLGDGVPTLAEFLRARGYATAAFVSGFPLKRGFGLERGFDRYDDAMQHGEAGWVERLAPETTAAALGWLRTRRDPFFTWVHFYDPHDPYDPPRAFWQPGPRGAYDGEVAFVDNALGELLAGIDPAVLARTLVVLTADHGEGLGDHQEDTHGFFLYDSTVLVPLVLRLPGRLPARAFDHPARLVDVLPTVLALLDVKPPRGLDGESLLPLVDGKSQPARPAYIETQLPWIYFGWASLRAVRHEDWKLVIAPRPELYDLQRDPHEADNREASERPRARRLADVARMIERETAAPPAAAVSDEQLAKLRALGYVGAGEQPSPEPPGRPDPKDRIAMRRDLLAAERLLRARRFSEAVAAFAKVLAVEPDNRFALLRTGVARLEAGDAAGATEPLARAVALDPRRAEARYALAAALAGAAKNLDALPHWLELVRLQPRRREAWTGLAHSLAAAGKRRESGEAQAELARLAAAAGDRDAAREALRASLAAAPELRPKLAAEPALAPLLP